VNLNFSGLVCVPGNFLEYATDRDQTPGVCVPQNSKERYISYEYNILVLLAHNCNISVLDIDFLVLAMTPQGNKKHVPIITQFLGFLSLMQHPDRIMMIPHDRRRRGSDESDRGLSGG